jgi:dihydroorotate dehydrogenase
MNYRLLRSLLFRLDPELSHHLSLKSLNLLEQSHLLKYCINQVPALKRNIFGLTFDNPVGLAAGLDKNGDYIDALGALGFGFLEIGTVTPKPQYGHPKPRLFRLEGKKAIINRMGFNNKGVEYLIHRVQQRTYSGILGINIGKNTSTPLERALDDYCFCLEKVYLYADYITINISSPNTPGLRNLQGPAYLSIFLGKLKQEQYRLAHQYNKYVPLLIKIAPDLTKQEIITLARAVVENKIDGIIATNTTLKRDQVQTENYGNEIGGLSGEPLFPQSTDVLTQIKNEVAPYGIPIIASGGIMSGEQARIKIERGADLIQLYTGLIYSGPQLISSCVHSLGTCTFHI